MQLEKDVVGKQYFLFIAPINGSKGADCHWMVTFSKSQFIIELEEKIEKAVMREASPTKENQVLDAALASHSC